MSYSLRILWLRHFALYSFEMAKATRETYTGENCVQERFHEQKARMAARRSWERQLRERESWDTVWRYIAVLW